MIYWRKKGDDGGETLDGFPLKEAARSREVKVCRVSLDSTVGSSTSWCQIGRPNTKTKVKFFLFTTEKLKS